MANALVLTASSSGRIALPGDEGFALEITGDEPVVVDAWPYPTGWEPDDVRLYREGRELQLPPADDECRWVLTGDDRFGQFTAMAFAAGRPVTSPALVIRHATTGAQPAEVPPPTPREAATPAPRRAPTSGAPAPAHASAEDLRALAELPTGEFDGRFAAVVGLLFAVLSAAILALVAGRLLVTIDVPPPATEPPPVVSHDGTVADRVGLASATLLMGFGMVLLLAGAALAALEVRGRQRRSGEPARWRTTERGLGLLPAVLDRLARTPATVGVLVTGGFMVGIGVVAQLAWSAGF